jgi:predicted transcriptional regulator
MKRTAPFSMRLDDELKADLQKLADAENRSLTNFVETALRRIVAEHKGKPDAKRK